MPEMSFLEMLDVLNEDLERKGEEPVEFDSDCREGICGTCGLVIKGVAHGPRLRMHHLRDAHAPLQGRRDDHRRAVPRGRVPGHQGPGRRSQGLRPHPAAGRLRVRRTRARRPTATPCRFRRRMPTRPWTPPPASVAAPASRRARTPRRRCSSAPRSASSRSCPRAGPSANAARWPWCADGPRRLRRLLEPRRVRGGLPKGDLDREHRPHAPRFHGRGTPFEIRSRRRLKPALSCRANVRPPSPVHSPIARSD